MALMDLAIIVQVKKMLVSICRLMAFVAPLSDIDECSLGKDDCGLNSACNNTIGGYYCACIVGYDMEENACVGIDTKIHLNIYIVNYFLCRHQRMHYH